MAIGPTRGYCEEIIFTLLREDGIYIEGQEMSLVVFDPTKLGGVLMADVDDLDDMSGWSLSGYSPPKG